MGCWNKDWQGDYRWRTRLSLVHHRSPVAGVLRGYVACKAGMLRVRKRAGAGWLTFASVKGGDKDARREEGDVAR